MDKVLNEALAEFSARFEGTEEFIRAKIEKICSREKIPIAKVINYSSLFYLVADKSFFFTVMVCLLLAFSIKNICLQCNKGIQKPKPKAKKERPTIANIF